MSRTRLEAQSPPREHRLHALCPYYAMFPPRFAREAILATTGAGDTILDPFCGRGTSVLEALLLGRQALGIDINPVAATISRAKADPPTLGTVINRIDQLEEAFTHDAAPLAQRTAASLPAFFRSAYSRKTLAQLVFLRGVLRWQTRRVDRFIGSLILGHLHGESETSPSYLSAQMPHTIAPKPGYAMRYWQAHRLSPPRRDVFALLRAKAEYRLQDGGPSTRGTVIRADARNAAMRLKPHRAEVAAIITSPPYLDVTRNEENQWLRMWFLGGDPRPTYGAISSDDRHRSTSRYFAFLEDVWRGVKPLTRSDAVLICRIGTTKLPFEDLRAGLRASVRSVWPRAIHLLPPLPSQLRNSQTGMIVPGARGCRVEYDFSFRLIP